jgi:capsule polysaccharide export protein KpsE/RkpR
MSANLTNSTTPAGEELDILGLVVTHWKRFVILAALGGALGLTYAFVAPKWYSATITVVPSQRSQDVVASALASKLPGALDTFTTDAQRINAVLTSNSVADEVITKFNLKDRYNTEHLEKARMALWTHCGTAVERKSGVVALSCEDTDPKLVKEMVGFFGEIGNRVFGRISVSSAREERKFLETQVNKARADVNESSRKLREFQEKHKIIDLPEQSKAVISAMASIKGELVSKQLELSYLSSFSARTESSVVQMQQQIEIMEKKLRELEAQQATVTTIPAAGSAAAAQGSANFFPGAMNVPELRFELEQLLREQKIAETVFFLMTQRFEVAKIDEARDTSTFQILDYPTVPTSAARPRKIKSGSTGIMVGLIGAAAWTILPIWWRSRSRRYRRKSATSA